MSERSVNFIARNWRSPEIRLRLRMIFIPLSILHTISLAFENLTIDFSNVEDIEMRKYSHVRFKLITTWFQAAMLINHVITLYTDIRTLCGYKQWEKLTYFSDTMFTSITLPNIFFACTLFWRLWNIDPNWIMPSSAGKYVGVMMQHRLHTLSLAIMIIDVLLVERRRPKSISLNLKIMMTYWTIYCVLAYTERIRGVYIYPAYGLMSDYRTILLCLTGYIDHLTYFYLQWPVFCYLWSEKRGDENKMADGEQKSLLNETKYCNRSIDYVVDGVKKVL